MIKPGMKVRCIVQFAQGYGRRPKTTTVSGEVVRVKKDNTIVVKAEGIKIELSYSIEQLGRTLFLKPEQAYLAADHLRAQEDQEEKEDKLKDE